MVVLLPPLQAIVASYLGPIARKFAQGTTTITTLSSTKMEKILQDTTDEELCCCDQVEFEWLFSNFFEYTGRSIQRRIVKALILSPLPWSFLLSCGKRYLYWIPDKDDLLIRASRSPEERAGVSLMVKAMAKEFRGRNWWKRLEYFFTETKSQKERRFLYYSLLDLTSIYLELRWSLQQENEE